MAFRTALRHRSFRLLWIAQVVSALGDRLHEIAYIWLVLEMTGDPVIVGLVVAVSTASTAVASLPAGAIADRWNRKYLLIVADLVRGVAVLAIPLVGRGGSLIAVVVVVGVVTGVADAVFTPARSALIPSLVPEDDLDAANGLSQLTLTASQSLYAVGGAIVAVVGAFGAFYVDALTFAVSAVVLLGIPGAASAPERDGPTDGGLDLGGAAADVRDGLAYIRGHRVLLPMILLLVVVTFAGGPTPVVVPVFARSILDGGSLAFGLLYSAYFVGMLVGGREIDRVTGLAIRHGQLIAGGTALSGLFLALVAFVPLLPGAGPIPLAAALLLYGLSGAAAILSQVPVETLAQTIVPDDKRGKVFSVLNASVTAAPPISVALAGPLLEVTGVLPVIFGMGAIGSLAGAAVAFTPLYRAEVGAPDEAAAAE